MPSQNALVFLLQQMGFAFIEIYKPREEDYEQMTRGHRVIIFARKENAKNAPNPGQE